MFKTSSLLVAIGCLCMSAKAQHQTPIFFKGMIRDAATGEAISYATVSLTRNGITTVSNEEGLFLFKIPAGDASDTIYISHIGYKSVALTMSGTGTAGRVARLDEAGPAPRLISLEKTSMQLPDVTVRHLDALGLIHSAIARIPDNYPTSPYKLTGFYRVTSGEGKDIIELTEAVFTIFSPDNQRMNDEFRLIKARAERDLLAFNGSGFLYGRRPRTLMNFDLVSRINSSPFLGTRSQHDHDFRLDGIIDYEGKPAYDIRFDQKDSVMRARYRGRIIIDTSTMAFVFFEYGRSPKGIKYVKPETYEDPNMHNILLDSYITTRYQQYGDKYYLNHVRTVSHHHAHHDGLHGFDMDPIEPKTNYLITRIDTGAAALTKEGDLVRDQDLIELQIKRNTFGGRDFFENYNSIEPDFNIDSALAIIRYENQVYVQRVR